MLADIHDGQERIVGEPKTVITLGPTPPQTPEERGEELFYSRQLSADKSCHDCHVDGHTNYQLADTLGDDTTGTPKRIPTLLGTSLTYPWAWNGKISELDDQVLACLRDGPQSTRDLASRLNLSPGGATSVLLMLAAEGKIRVTGVELAETA